MTWKDYVPILKIKVQLLPIRESCKMHPQFEKKFWKSYWVITYMLKDIDSEYLQVYPTLRNVLYVQKSKDRKRSHFWEETQI